MNNPDCDVIICGAGPVGLTAALKLCLHGLRCHILEKRRSLNLASKASTFHPPTLEMLDEFGLLNVMLDLGCKAERISYMHAGGDVFAKFDQPASLAKDTPIPYRVHLEQSAITPHLLRKAIDTGLASISYDTEVCAVTQDDTGVVAKTTTGQAFRATYLLGADGGQSAVRTALGIVQDGHPYPGQILRLIVDKSVADHIPNLTSVSYVYAPDRTSISLLEMPDCWRIIIRVPEGVADDEARSPDWYGPIIDTFLPGVRDKLKIIGTDVYRASKMIAATNRKGRAGLIGDAVHLTNTKGGMNMNCGIHDAYAVASGLIAALAGGADTPCPLTQALDERLRVATAMLLPRTDKNVTGDQAWLDFIADAAGDPKKARHYLLTSSMIDMAPARKR